VADALNSGAPWPTIVAVVGDDGGGGKRRVEAGKAERRRASSRRKGMASTLVRKFLRMRATRDMTRAVAANISRARMMAMGATSVGASVGGSFSRVVGGGPVGWMAAAIGLASVAAVRGLSGRSFEGMSLEVERVLLGDSPEDAMAAQEARDALTGSAQVLRVVDARGDSTGDDLRRIYEMQRGLSRQRIKGEREIRRKLDVNSPMDLLALRLWEAMRKLFDSPTMQSQLLNVMRYIVARQSNPLAAGGNLGLKMGMAIGRAIASR
jgi:hypothetical protein